MRPVLTWLLLAASAQGAFAQIPVRERRFAEPASVVAASTGSVPSMVAAGLSAGVVGLVVGGYIGARLTDDPNSYEDLDALAGGIAGGTIGESLLLPVGVHLAAGRHGNLLKEMLVSTAIGTGGVWLAIKTQDAAPLPGVILVLTPIAQLFTVIRMERRAAR